MDYYNIIDLLNNLGLSKTADSFKTEIGSSKLNKQNKERIVENLYKALSNQNHKDYKHEESKGAKNENKNITEKDNQFTFNNFLMKLEKNIDSLNKIEDNKKLCETDLFKKLVKKIEKQVRHSKYDKVYTKQTTKHSEHEHKIINDAFIRDVNNIEEREAKLKDKLESLNKDGKADSFIPKFALNNSEIKHNTNSLDHRLITNDLKNEEDSFIADEDENLLDNINRYSANNNEITTKTEKFLKENNNVDSEIEITKNNFFFQSDAYINTQRVNSTLYENVLDYQVYYPQDQEEEYVDDDDPGFDLYECEPQFFEDTCIKLNDQYKFSKRAVRIKRDFDKNKPFNVHNHEVNENKEINNSKENKLNVVKVIDSEAVATNTNKGEKIYEVDNCGRTIDTTKKKNYSEIDANSLINKRKNLLPSDLNYIKSDNPYYPILFNNTIYDSISINFIVDRERTGFEESKDFKVVVNSLIAGRYQVIEYLGSAVFSKAIKVSFYTISVWIFLKIG